MEVVARLCTGNVTVKRGANFDVFSMGVERNDIVLEESLSQDNVGGIR